MPEATHLDYFTDVLTQLQRLHDAAAADSALAEITEAAGDHIGYLLGYLAADNHPA